MCERMPIPELPSQARSMTAKSTAASNGCDVRRSILTISRDPLLQHERLQPTPSAIIMREKNRRSARQEEVLGLFERSAIWQACRDTGTKVLASMLMLPAPSPPLCRSLRSLRSLYHLPYSPLRPDSMGRPCLIQGWGHVPYLIKIHNCPDEIRVIQANCTPILDEHSGDSVG